MPYKISEVINGLELVLEPERISPQTSGNHTPKTDLGIVFQGVPRGERDDMLNRFVWSRLAKGISQEEVTELVLTAARRCNPPFDKKEALKKVDRAIAKFANKDSLTEAQNTVRDLLSKSKQERRSAAFEPANIGALAVVREKDPALFLEFKDGAKGYLPDITKAITKSRFQVVCPGDEQAPTTIAAMLGTLGVPVPEGIDGLVLPDRYVIDNAGTATLRFTNDGPKRIEIAHTYFLVKGKSCDLSTGDEFLQLQYFSPQGWRMLTVPRGVAVNARLCADLANQGYPVGSHNAREIARAHYDFEAANEHTLPAQKVSSACGWIEDSGKTSFMWGKCHIPADSDSDTISFQGADVGDNQIAAGFHGAGDMGGWLHTIAPIKDFDHPRLALYSSFAAALLRIIKASNLGVDFSSRTSTGKTTLERIAASAWGNPVEREQSTCLHTWDSTLVAVERICGIASDLPILLDDSKKAKPGHIGQTLYSIISGHGRTRGSIKGLRATSTWRTVLISTGEGRVVSYSTEGGVRARIIEVGGLPFKADNHESKKIVDALNTGVSQHYGHAGPLFVRWLLENRARWDEFKERFAEIKANYEGETGAAGRIGDMAAVIDLAGELAHESIAFPWEFRSPFDTLWDDIESSFDDIDIDVRALKDVVSWACSNEETFFGRNELRVYRDRDGEPVDSHERAPARGWSGRWDRGTTWKFIGFYPNVLKEVLEKGGYKDFDAIMSGWKERGIIDAPDKNTFTKVVKVRHDPQRLVIFKREALPDMGITEEDNELDEI
jgi:putative DNA primase/helicase